jgi:hypothetical protein
METKLHNEHLVDAYRGCSEKLASKDVKNHLFRMHREVFPEIKSSTEIAWRLCKLARVNTLLALPENKVPELESALWAIMEARTAPAEARVNN